MKTFSHPNAPLNLPVVEALELMAGPIPECERDEILRAPFNDDLSGLRQMATQIERPDPHEWQDCLQPKRMIADYVAENGIRVPRRYGTLDHALKAVRSGDAVILRSEHPWEYAKFSGLLESYMIDVEVLQRTKDEDSFLGAITNGASEEEVLDLAKRQTLEGLPFKRIFHMLVNRSMNLARRCHFLFGNIFPVVIFV